MDEEEFDDSSFDIEEEAKKVKPTIWDRLSEDFSDLFFEHEAKAKAEAEAEEIKARTERHEALTWALDESHLANDRDGLDDCI